MENIENKIKTTPKDFCVYRSDGGALRQRCELVEFIV